MVFSYTQLTYIMIGRKVFRTRRKSKENLRRKEYLRDDFVEIRRKREQCIGVGLLVNKKK